MNFASAEAPQDSMHYPSVTLRSKLSALTHAGKTALLAGLLLAVASPGQTPQADCERARALAATEPAEALRLVERAIGAGVDTCDAHLLHARLLLGAGDHAAASTAVRRAQACIARETFASKELLDRIERALAAAKTPAPRGDAKADHTQPTPTNDQSLIPATAPRDLGQERRDADAMRDARQTAAAAEAYGRIAEVAVGKVAEDSRDEVVRAVQQMARDAEALTESNAAEAERTLSAAFHHVQVLRKSLDDPDRSLEAMKALAQSKNIATQRRAGGQLVEWIREDTARSNEAAAKGDTKGSRRAGLQANRAQMLLLGTGPEDDQVREGFEARGLSDDASVRRRALEDHVAWAKNQLRLAEQALRDHDLAAARSKFRQAQKSAMYMRGCGEEDLAATITCELAESADAEIAAAARTELEGRADDLTRRAASALQAGQDDAAADLLAVAYWSRPMRTQVGLQAAEIYMRLGQRLEALALYRHLAAAKDSDASTTARARLDELQQWATAAFLSVRQQFQAALGNGEQEEAIALAEAPLAILEQAKLDAAKDAIAVGMDTKESLAEMGELLAKGQFPSDAEATGDSDQAPISGRAPAPGEPFVASFGLRMRPIAAQTMEASGGGTVTTQQPFWATEAPVTDTQVTKYKASLLSYRDKGAEVSWNNALMFCLYLTRKEREAGRLPPGYSYSLPTEAEWEHLHRESTLTARPASLTYEWCLDAIDPLAPRGMDDHVAPYSPSGTHRICRSTDPTRPRLMLPPERGQNVQLRVVLAARSELAPPYKN